MTELFISILYLILGILQRCLTWYNFRNNHDEGTMQICCSHENSIYVQACRDALFAEFALINCYQPFQMMYT